MKNALTLLFTLIALNSVFGQTENYKVDVKTTTIKWIGKKVTGQHDGKINVSQGNLLINEGKLVGGSITIDMNSITCDDIDDEESNSNLVGHLKNEDFFHTSLFPHSKLTINKAVPLPNNEYKIVGTLEIKGIKKLINFKAKLENEGGNTTADAKLVFDRTKFNVRYGSTLFGAAADKAIDNNVELQIHLVSTR